MYRDDNVRNKFNLECKHKCIGTYVTKLYSYLVTVNDEGQIIPELKTFVEKNVIFRRITSLKKQCLFQ